VKAMRPEAIYLFGSRAEDREGPDSDYDLLVVMPDETPADRLGAVAGYEAVRGTGIAADVLPCRRRAFERNKLRPGTLSYVAWRRGRRVYGA
jgi:uncharacterized protein